MRVGYVVMTAVFYALAALIWYLLCILTPYMDSVTVSAQDDAALTRAAFTAAAEQSETADADKERALLMPTSADSFYRRLYLIEGAQKTVDHMVFTAFKGSFSLYYYTALLRAADRGVKVRIIVDGKLGKPDKDLAQIGRLIQNHNNIEMYYFNPFNIWRPMGLMTLLHDKVTIVDGDKMIVGGVNMGTSSYMDNFDMEIMITNSGAGGSVGQAERYFDELVESKLTVRKISKKCDFSLKTEYISQYSAFYENYELSEAINYSTQGVPIDRATYLHNKISDGKKAPIILQAIFNLAGSSKKTTIVTPYTLLVDNKKKRLRELAAVNTEFTIVTNSLYNARNVAYAEYYYSRRDYIDSNIALLEYQAKNQIHAKMCTFDERFSMIGSFNMDERSAHIDTESVVVIDSPAFTEIVDNYIRDVFIANSLRVGENNEYVPSDTVVAGDVPTGKRLKYVFYNALSVVINLL